jgi:probable F420-dependent oxidoreductase
MKIGVASVITDQSISIEDYYRTCESLGFESAFIGEHPIIPVEHVTPFPAGGAVPERYKRFPDPFVALAVAAAVTKTIKVGTCVCLVPERDPILLAKEVASVDYFSHGRFIFGVGGGWFPEETAIMGANFKRRWPMTVEYLKAARELWTKDEASFEGEFVRFPKVYCYPKPVQKPHPPIHIGAGGFNQSCARALRNTVAIGDGWMPVYLPPERLKKELATLRQMCEQAGRDFSKIEISVVLIRPESEDPKGFIEQYTEAGCHRFIFGDMILPPHGEGQRILEKIAKDYIL